MINPSLIGAISLNISTVLYFTCYLPQLVHNQRGEKLQGLSLSFHYILFVDYLLDLVYGFALDLPWQYKLVSLTGVIFLVIQQKQLYQLRQKSCLSNKYLLLLFLICFAIYLLPLSLSGYLAIGYLVHALNIAFYLPQIKNNFKMRSAALSLSLSFLSLHLLSVLLDNLNAWCLNWPLPSKIGALTTSLLSLILLCQWLYAYRRS